MHILWRFHILTAEMYVCLILFLRTNGCDRIRNNLVNFRSLLPWRTGPSCARVCIFFTLLISFVIYVCSTQPHTLPIFMTKCSWKQRIISARTRWVNRTHISACSCSCCFLYDYGCGYFSVLFDLGHRQWRIPPISGLQTCKILNSLKEISFFL